MTAEGDNRSAGFRAAVFALRQPAWVVRLAAGAGLLVFAAVLTILLVPAAIIAVLVFLAAAAALAVSARVRSLFQSPFRVGGRRNVRVLPPRE